MTGAKHLSLLTATALLWTAACNKTQAKPESPDAEGTPQASAGTESPTQAEGESANSPAGEGKLERT